MAMEQASQLNESQVTLSDNIEKHVQYSKENPIIKCPSCDYTSTNKHYFKQHMDLVHTNERPFKCPFCNYAGKRSHALKEHLVVHSTERPYQCSHCNATFRKKAHLTNHSRMHSNLPKTRSELECSVCNFVAASSQDELYKHQRSVHGSRNGVDLHFCEHCSFVTSDKSNILMHEAEHADYRNVVLIKPKLPPDTQVILKCSDCGFETSNKTKFEAHVVSKHSISRSVKEQVTRQVSPQFVSKYPNSKSGKEQRVLQVTPEQSAVPIAPTRPAPAKVGLPNAGTTGIAGPTGQTHRCVLCTLSFSSHDELLRHLVLHKEIGVKKPKQSLKVSKCYQCGFTSENQRELLLHITSHKDQKAIAAEAKRLVPVNVTSSKQSETNDLSTASEQQSYTYSDNMYVCNFCGYECDLQRTIKAHMWKHSGHKNLAYPTFQNGPLSIYDGTILSAKNFVNVDRAALRAMFAKQSDEYTNNTGQAVCVLNNEPQGTAPAKPVNVCVTAPAGKKSSNKLIHPDSQVRSADAPKVIVQQIDSSETMVMTSSITSSNIITTTTAMAPEIAAQHEVIQAIIDTPVSSSSVGNPLEVMTAACDVVNKQASDIVMPKITSTGVSKFSATPTAITTIVEPASTSTITTMDTDAENDEVMSTAVVKPRDAAAITKQKSHVWSDTEQSAATLLSLLRQGPNFNPACPKPLAGTESPSKRENLEIGAEETVNAEPDESVSSDGTQTYSDISASSKPKSGICSSLLAVIEQLRERHVKEEDELDENADKPQPKSRKRKRQSSSSEDIELPSDLYPNVEELTTGSSKAAITYRCKLCHYSSNASLMKQHLKMHRNKKPFECSLCSFIAASNSALQDHMILHCRSRQYQCKRCSAVFNYKSQLRAHARVHEDGQAYYCVPCDYVTSSLIAFKEHITEHPGDVEIHSYGCIACRQEFSDLHVLQSHMKDQCAEVKRLHGYDDLPTDSVNTAASSRPVSTETEESDKSTVKCDQCDFVALSIRSLKSHSKRHINDKKYIQQPLEQYKCNMCGYVCHHLPSLKSHMWKHAGEASFSYSFSDLLSEGKTPVDKEGKPLITLRCCQCGFETLSKKNLDIHMKTHWDIIKKTFDVWKQGDNTSSN